MQNTKDAMHTTLQSLPTSVAVLFFNGLYTYLGPRRIILYYIGFNLIAKYEVGVLRIVDLLNPTPDPVFQNLSLEMYRIFKISLLIDISYW